jgi:hypothetical protein
MSSVSAGLVNATNLTVTGTQSGAVTATNFNTTNVNTQNVNASGAVKIGSLNTVSYEIGTTISTNYKTSIASYSDSVAWDSSKGVIGSGPGVILPFTGNQTYVPTASTFLYKNGDTHFDTAGIANFSNLNVAPTADSQMPLYSLTKTVTAALYARFRTLGYITDQPVALSSIWPAMNNITFQLPVYSDTSNTNTIGQIPSNAFWQPGKYVSVGTPRTPYLEDVLGESVGFLGGYYFSFLYGGNPNNFMGGANIIASANGRPLTDYWFKFIYDSSNILISPWTLVNNYFNSFIVDASNKAMNKIVMVVDNGVFNYNISGAFSTGALLKIYQNNNPGFTGNYFDMLKKELLTPVGSNMCYWFTDASDVRFPKLISAWTTTKTGGVTDGSGYCVDNSVRNAYIPGTSTAPLDISTSPAQGNVNGAQAPLWTNFTSDPSPPMQFFGNYGLIGTFADYVAFSKLFLNNGVLPNGQRLINAKHLAFINQCRTTPASYNASPVGVFIFKNLSSYSMGIFARGPSSNPILAIGNNDPSLVYSVRPPSSVPQYGATYANWSVAPEDEVGWFGANGVASQICPNRGTVFLYDLNDCGTSPELPVSMKYLGMAENEYMNSGTNTLYIAP